jgi:glycosyltransferase involved in cell wall biosynthesis
LKPEFSVIIAVNNNIPDEEVFRCLASFYPQEGDIPFEFIVVDEADESRRQVYRSRFPWATLLTIKKMMRGSYPRNLALQQARGDYIVFLEDHVTVRRDHLLRLREIFEKGYDAVGGSVINGCPESLGAWLQYFCEYHRWLPSRPSGDIPDFPGCNFAYRASTLKDTGFFVESRFKVESLYNARAKNGGARFYFASELPAVHYNYDAKTVLKFWRYRFLYGWNFAAHRRLRLVKRLAFALAAPVLVGLAYFRAWKDVRRDQALLNRFWKMTPILLLTLVIWSMGEMCGYLVGSCGPVKQRSTEVS